MLYSESELLQDKQMASSLNGYPLCPQIFYDQLLTFQTRDIYSKTTEVSVMETGYTSLTPGKSNPQSTFWP